jgi:hypothetical protein
MTERIAGLNDVFETSHSSLNKAVDLIQEGMEASTKGEFYLNTTTLLVKQLYLGFDAVCPDLVYAFCSDPLDLDTCTSSGVHLKEISIEYDDALSSIQNVRSDLEMVNANLQSAQDVLDEVDWLFRLSLTFSILLALLCAALICAMQFTWPTYGAGWERMTKSSRQFFLPTFIVLVVVAFSLAIAFIIVSTGMADVCASSPDQHAKTFLIKEQESMTGVVAEVAQYYIDGT